MAFTSSEKRQIRSYLGYSGGYRDRGIALESMMDVVGEQVDEAAYARELLAGIDEIDQSLADSGSGASATYGALKKVDEIEFYDTKLGTTATTTLTGVKYGEVLIERLRALFGVELAGRYFRSRASNTFCFAPSFGG